MRKITTLLAAAGAALLAATAANAAVIYPVSATGSSSYPGYADADAIDQDAAFEISDWAALGQGASAWLNLDLGAVYKLDEAYVTDRVTSGGPNNAFYGGFWDFTTKFSLQAYTDNTFTTALAPALVFTKAQPGQHAQPSDFLYVADVNSLQGRYLRYSVLETNGVNPGLSDIHFSGSAAVPEPAAWGLMIVGFGGMGVMLRRRRALAAAAA